MNRSHQIEKERKAGRGRTYLKRAGVVLGIGFGVSILCLLLALLPPVRRQLLREAVTRADDALPGSFTVREVEWPSLGTVELAGVLWVDGSDTLAAAERVTVSAELRALMRRDIILKSLEARGLVLDLPTLLPLLPARGVEAPPEVIPTGRGEGFPRRGSLPGIPSLAIRELSIDISRFSWSENDVLHDLVLHGGFDVTREEKPWLKVIRARAMGPEREWGLENLSLEVDLATGVLSGRGRLLMAPDQTLSFDLATDDEDRFRLTAGGSGGSLPPDDVGIALRGNIERKGLEVHALNFAGHIRTPSTTAFEEHRFLGPILASLFPLPSLPLSLDGRLELDPAFRLVMKSDLGASEWILGGGASLSLDHQGITLSEVTLDVEGLTISGAASMRPDSTTARARVDLRNALWARYVLPEANLPAGLHAAVEARVSRAASDRTYAVRVEGNAGWEGLELDRLSFEGKMDPTLRSRSEFRIGLRSFDYGLFVAGEAERDEVLRFRLSPIRIVDPDRSRDHVDLDPSAGARISFDADGKDLTVEDLEIHGDLGRHRLSAEMRRGGEAEFEISSSWSTPPKFLFDRLPVKKPEADSLRRAWESAGPYTIELSGSGKLGEEISARASAALRLPGPESFEPLLPAALRAEDLGAIEGGIDLRLRKGDEGMSVVSTVDLSRSAWIDTGMAELRWEGGTLSADRLNLTLLGIRIDGSGRVEKNDWDLEARLRTRDFDRLRNLIAGSENWPNVRAMIEARVRGNPRSPDAEISMLGSISGPSIETGEIRTTAVWNQEVGRLELDVPEGLTAAGVKVERMRLAAVSLDPARGPWPARVDLDLRGEPFSVRKSSRIDFEGGWSAAVDSLDLSAFGMDLSAAGPFRIAQRSDRLTVEEMRLTGSLGFVHGNGFIDPDTAHFDLDAEFSVPEDLVLNVPRKLRPSRVQLSLKTRGAEKFDLSLSARGYSFTEGRNPVLRVDLEQEGEGSWARVVLGDSQGDFLKVDAVVPAVFTVYPAAGSWVDGPLKIDARFDDFPIPLDMIGSGVSRSRGKTSSLDGTVRLEGSAERPAGRVDLQVTFPEWPQLERYGLEIGASYGLEEGADGAPERAKDESRSGSNHDRSSSSYSQLRGSLSLKRYGIPIVQGTAHYPGRFSLTGPIWKTDPEGSMDLTVESSPVALQELDVVLPADVGIAGVAELDFSIRGPALKPALEGRLLANQVALTLVNKTRIVTNSNLRLSGDLERPGLTGTVNLSTGIIRIPEMQSGLHPAEGKSLLRTSIKRVDGTGETAAVVKATLPPMPFGTAVDLTVDIPGGLFIRGNGLDVELSGRLYVKQKDGVPVIEGKLSAVRGTLNLLGRSFLLERGTVTFQGEKEVNPSLDVQLIVIVSGTKVRILFAGTAAKPEIILSSEPELSETDIISVLVFGKPMSELNDDQTDQIQNRARAIALQIGAAELQEKVASDLGIDVVQIRTGDEIESDRRDRTQVAFGKYLTPKLLISYVQPLNTEDEGVFVSLEYFLQGNFKVETLFGNRGQSGLGFSWMKEY